MLRSGISGKKCAAYLAHLHDPQCTTKKYVLRIICSTVQLKLCEMQNFWLSITADEILGYTDKNDMKNFYTSLKEVYGPTSAGSSLLLSADRTKLISGKNKTLERCAEHFDGVLNRPSFINDKAIFYQWQGHWMTATSTSEWVTWCHSNPGGSSDRYPSTIQRQSMQIWLSSCGNL